MVHATPLSAAYTGCFWLSINHIRLQPVPFIGHRATTWSANHQARDASAASVLLIGAVPGTKQIIIIDDDVYGAVLMTVVTARVHPVHLMNAD